MFATVKHPIFSLPLSKLYGLYGKYTDGGNSATENWLLYNALLESTGLVTYTCPAESVDPITSAHLIANNLPRLIETIGRIDAVKSNLRVNVFASVSVNVSNNTLSTSNIWIDVWNQNYIDYLAGARKEITNRNVRNREAVLQRHIKGKKGIDAYSKILANWAAEAAVFPTYEVINEVTGKKDTLANYWKMILIMCNKEERIYSIPKADLDELIDHCEANITESSIYSTTLYTLLKNGRLKQKNYLGLGELDISGSPYRIVQAGQSVEDANKLALIDSAPKTEPVESSYPSRLAYIRAKMNYKMAQDYRKAGTNPNSILESL